jgi:hypothetical protein
MKVKEFGTDNEKRYSAHLQIRFLKEEVCIT